ncbi:MAG: glycoside hydrolase family 88 protein [Lachnospiraceae bacterium]|nr:glycoside hydrolase family 88 protein [Lachnospiraceae bacterium]
MKNVIAQHQNWIDATWEKVDKKLSRTAVKSREKIPYTTVNGEHDNRVGKGITWWTNGFWGGMMWLMYEATGNEEYRKTAERSEELLDDALRQYKALHHDVGFMWHLTSGANYRLTGNEASAVRNFFAATTLFSRYNIDGDFIRAWNGEAQAGYSIIDCLMNIPLLYWATDEIGDDRFKKIAMRHMEMAMRDHIRPDGSVNHIVNHEVDKVGVQNILGGQGYDETSCWSRGLAWAVYGSVLSYIHAGKEEYLEAAKKTADYFIEHCKKTDYLPVVDFTAPETPVYYDSTAGVCTACGLLEIAKYVSEEEAKYYTEEAINILKACDEHFCNYEEDEDALVLMGTERYPHTEAGRRGLHIPIIYGDFFFVEALCKLKGREFLIW